MLVLLLLWRAQQYVTCVTICVFTHRRLCILLSGACFFFAKELQDFFFFHHIGDKVSVFHTIPVAAPNGLCVKPPSQS